MFLFFVVLCDILITHGLTTNHRIFNYVGIGLDCIVSLSIKTVDSQLKGTTQALYVLTKYRASKFEFIFTSLVRNSPRLFTTIQVRPLALMSALKHTAVLV